MQTCGFEFLPLKGFLSNQNNKHLLAVVCGGQGGASNIWKRMSGAQRLLSNFWD